MQKAIGFIVCVSVMAASLYLFSGGDPSRVLSAQTESTDVDSYGSVARRFMNDARQLAKQGDVTEARRLAETAASLSARWEDGEQTPQQFLAELDGRAADTQQNPFSTDESAKWPALKSEAGSLDNSDNPFSGTAVAENPDAADPPLPKNASLAVVNKYKAQKLLKEARAALKVRDFAVARSRAMQARAMKVSWGLWDERPDHVLAEIDEADGTQTFFADGSQPGSQSPGDPEQIYQQAQRLIAQARTAIEAGNLELAASLTEQADGLDASYGLFEDSPAILRRDIARLSQAGAAPATVFSGDEMLELSKEEQLAGQLLQEARAALSEGRLEEARDKAQQALSLNVAYSLLADRPELILAEVDRALAGDSLQAQFGGERPAMSAAAAAEEDPAFAAFGRNNPVDVTPEERPSRSPFDSESAVVGVNGTQDDEARVVNPVGSLPKFPSIDPIPAEDASTADSEPSFADVEKPDPLVDAANELDVRFTRLRTEVLNSVFRAEKLKEQNPEDALAVLTRTRETVEAADLPEESMQVLTSHLQRSEKSIQTWMEQRAPIIAMEARNRNVRESIEVEVKNQMRIEQEFADLTKQFNDLMRQRRYGEAELIGKKARDLNPDLPQAVIMVEKAKLHKQIAFNDQLKEDKADGFLAAMNAVERAAIASDVDFKFGDSWAELSERRSRRYSGADSRTRTESELKIEKALSETISLHFHDVPLTDIIRHVATAHGINIALDTRAIETEGLVVNQSVSIDVDDITLRSALNLLLDQAGGLVYDIENEVLKITNRLEQETTYRTRVYNVADLVIPMNLKHGPGPLDTDALNGGGRFGGLGLYQVEDDLAVSIAGNGSARGAAGGRNAANDGPDFSGLIDLITTTVEPGTWDLDGGSGRLDGSENTLSLVIRQTPAVHEQIVDLLGQLRKLQDIQVTVEVRFISVTDRFFERIGIDFDFNVQDNLGDPPGVPAFGSRQLTFPGSTGGGGGGGGGGGQDLRGNQGGGGGGQQGQQGQQAQGLFDTINRVNSPRDDFSGQTVGMSSPDSFTEDYDIQFRQGSFELGVPDFGNFNPDAGIQVGMAILSDIEAFFFIQAAQADERANLLFAPKVTMFNGQVAVITDQTTRPFVGGLIPVVGTGAVGFQPIIQQIQEGIQLSVLAVVSADRRFVRLSLAPTFNNLVDIFTFSFASGGAGGGAIGGQGGGGGGFGGGGGGFGGQGGGGGGGGFGFGGIGGGQGGGGGGFGGQGGGGQQGQQGQAGAAGGTLTVQQPVIETISVQTTVSVPDGGTVLLGGIKRLREGRNMAGVPILNKIPYVSRLFKNSGVGRETESVMMMVTPRIIIQEEEEELILGTSGL